MAMMHGDTMQPPVMMMMLAQGPDGQTTLVPAPTPGHGQTVLYPHSHHGGPGLMSQAGAEMALRAGGHEFSQQQGLPAGEHKGRLSLCEVCPHNRCETWPEA